MPWRWPSRPRYRGRPVPGRSASRGADRPITGGGPNGIIATKRPFVPWGKVTLMTSFHQQRKLQLLMRAQ
jgi:hypothetical protein